MSRQVRSPMRIPIEIGYRCHFREKPPAYRGFLDALQPKEILMTSAKGTFATKSANWRPEQVQQGARLMLRLLDHLGSENLH